MSFEQKIIDAQNLLNFNEKETLKLLYKSRDSIDNKSLSEVAKSVHMSNSFVSKLIKKIGYSSFIEFKLDIQNGKALADDRVNSPGNIMKLQVSDLQETSRLLNQVNFSDIFDMLDSAENIYCYGTGHTQQSYMRELSRNLMNISNKRVIYLTGQSELESIGSIIDAKDCFIVASSSGETKSLLNNIEPMALMDVPIISITSFSTNSLVRLAKYNLFYMQTNLPNPSKKKQTVHLSLSLGFCIDTLIRKYMEHIEDEK